MTYWRLGVIGSPIAHSLSPRLHETALRELGLAGSSEAVDITRDDAGALSDALGAHDALSVTMPLKEVIVGRCTELDVVAQRLGAVNSILVSADRVEGRSTDGPGFIAAIHHELAIDLRGANVVVRGSGATARSLVDALASASAQVTVIARNVVTASELQRRHGPVSVNPRVVPDVDLVVNTVPVGEPDDLAMSRTELTYRPGAAAFDVVYEPRETPWLAARRAEGLIGLNGLSMLVHQARLQMQWWFARAIPLEALVEAVSE